MKRQLPHLLLSLSAGLLAACGESADGAAAARADGTLPVVATTFYPTTWLVERLSGGEVEIVLPLPAGEDPIFWQPSRDALQTYQAADLILVNGAELEKWVAGASLPLSRVVDTAAGFEQQWREFDGLKHAHGGGGEHSHVGVDGHTWLSYELFERQAEVVAKALESRGLVKAETVASGLKQVRGALRALQARLQDEVLPLTEGVRLLTNHPAYDYLLADRVDLVNLDVDPGSDDADGIVAQVAAGKADAGRCVMLWESEPLPNVAAALLRELGIPSVVFSPAENPGADEGDYAAIQGQNLQRLLDVLRSL